MGMTPAKLYKRIDKAIETLIVLGRQVVDGREYIETKLKAAGMDVEIPQLKSVHQDPAVNVFQQRCQQFTGVPYTVTSHDMVELSNLRRAYKIGYDVVPPEWQFGIANYFASPLPRYTMAELCNRYIVFKNSPVDRYGKPVNHSAGSSNTNAARDFLKRRTQK